jgi:riboflavin synthase
MGRALSDHVVFRSIPATPPGIVKHDLLLYHDVMFTGLVESLGTVRSLRLEGAGRRLVIAVPPFAGELTVGDSVAINGACLTVVASDAETCSFEVAPETLRRTNLGRVQPGDRVNLERSLRLSDRLGGHLVQGHVDAVGTFERREPDGDWVMVWFRCPSHLLSHVVSKGSIAVDGVSLTVVDVTDEAFSVALIPHTLAVTTLGFRQPGDPVNLETDLLAKYVHKALAARRPDNVVG